MSDPPQPKETALPLALLLVLFVAVFFFPPLGLIVGIFSPVPLILLYLSRGQGAGLTLTALVFVVLFLMLGPRQAVLFFAEYAVMALIMAETIRLGFPFDRTVFFSGLAAATLSILVLFVVFSNGEMSVTEFFEQQIKEHVRQSMEALKSGGQSPAELQDMKQFLEDTSRAFAGVYPGFIAIGSLITAAGNYALVRFLWKRFYGESPLFAEKFSLWMLPDQFIWLFILSAAFSFLGEGSLGMLGLNVVAVMLLVYCFQGLAIVVYFMETRRIPVFLWVVIFFLIFIQPIFLGLVIGLGVFDIWVDFRKLKVKPTGSADES